MKEFKSVSQDIAKVREELGAFKSLLNSHEELSESKDLIPFFRNNRQLSCFLGRLHPNISLPDQLAFEFDLFGDFRCDIVVADSRKKAFLFVELEDACKESVFRKKQRLATEWSDRFEHSFS
ncbi:MAG: DUF4263 domain-containing protein, partial [Nitrososphaera sp.]|nr:DUF4263 domain-containing protein [Nitrososphaera sp.]